MWSMASTAGYFLYSGCVTLLQHDHHCNRSHYYRGMCWLRGSAAHKAPIDGECFSASHCTSESVGCVNSYIKTHEHTSHQEDHQMLPLPCCTKSYLVDIGKAEVLFPSDIFRGSLHSQILSHL